MSGSTQVLKPGSARAFRLRGSNPLWPGVPAGSTIRSIGNFPGRMQPIPPEPSNPAPDYACTQSRLSGLGSSLFARHYSGSRGFFPFLWLLRCVSSPAYLPCPMCSGKDDWALPQPGSPIRKSAGQRLFSASPRLIAAVHVLLRLLVPRHPPYALTILTEEHHMMPLCRFQGACGAVFRKEKPHRRRGLSKLNSVLTGGFMHPTATRSTLFSRAAERSGGKTRLPCGRVTSPSSLLGSPRWLSHRDP